MTRALITICAPYLCMNFKEVSRLMINRCIMSDFNLNSQHSEHCAQKGARLGSQNLSLPKVQMVDQADKTTGNRSVVSFVPMLVRTSMTKSIELDEQFPQTFPIKSTYPTRDSLDKQMLERK